jgi:hypothetical protein
MRGGVTKRHVNQPVPFHFYHFSHLTTPAAGPARVAAQAQRSASVTADEQEKAPGGGGSRESRAEEEEVVGGRIVELKRIL